MAEPVKNASPWQVAKAVFWSFLGIRKRAQHEKDVGTIKPVQVIVAGLIGAVIFIFMLVTIVRYVVGHAG
jgi:hypothetical protein